MHFSLEKGKKLSHQQFLAISLLCFDQEKGNRVMIIIISLIYKLGNPDYRISQDREVGRVKNMQL